MNDLRDLTLEEVQNLAVSLDVPKFRGKQLFQWIHKGITDFGQMNNLPKVFREALAKEWTLDPLTVLRHQKSKQDGTQKFLYGLEDGNAVETVFMKYHYGNTVCISSQAGCRMGCAFCASGINGLVRNLTAGEMVSQVLDTERETGQPISRVVVMGTGEPFDNYQELSRFLRILNDKNGRNMGMRNFTVSTCGLLPGIRQFAMDFPQVNLAISLHAPTDEKRSKLMPVNRKYSLGELMKEIRAYEELTSRRVTFEYALIRGENDGSDDVEHLCQLLAGNLCHVNLIPLNEVREIGLPTAGQRRAEEIREVLEHRGIPATVRRQLGDDIQGACGQLRLENSQKYIERT